MKYLWQVFILLLGGVSLHAQQLQFNAPSVLTHGRHCDIRSSPGVIGDNYYILYYDYSGRKADRDLPDSYLAVYSTGNGKLIHNVNLNTMVAGIGKDQHILFTDVFIWKNRLLGLYIVRSLSGTQLNLYARLLDEKGSSTGNPALLETLSYTSLSGRKDKSSDVNLMINDLHYAFNDDSSSIAIYYTGDTWKGFDPVMIITSLEHISKRKTGIQGNDQLLQCIPHGENTLLMLVKRSAIAGKALPAYGLLVAHTLEDKQPSYIPLSLPDKIIQDVRFHINEAGDIVATGTYTLSDKAVRLASTYGFFALRLDLQGKLLHSDIRPFADGMVSDLAGYKAAHKRKGLGDVIRMNRVIPLAATGLAAVGESLSRGSEATAYPVVLSPHYDVSGEIVLTGINPTGEIKWISYLNRYYEDYPSASMPLPFYATGDENNHLLVIYDENGEQRTRQQIFIDHYGNKGIQDREWLPLPRSFNTRSTWILWNTACNMHNDAIMVAYYNTWKKQLGTLKIDLAGGVRITANP
jgi:hypothetical protein